MAKDWALRSLAIAAYFFAFYFSIQSFEHPEILALVWGCASLFYWWVTNEFEQRDRKWEKET